LQAERNSPRDADKVLCPETGSSGGRWYIRLVVRRTDPSGDACAAPPPNAWWTAGMIITPRTSVAISKNEPKCPVIT
jgi:hypothetical protein